MILPLLPLLLLPTILLLTERPNRRMTRRDRSGASDRVSDLSGGRKEPRLPTRRRGYVYVLVWIILWYYNYLLLYRCVTASVSGPESSQLPFDSFVRTPREFAVHNTDEIIIMTLTFWCSKRVWGIMPGKFVSALVYREKKKFKNYNDLKVSANDFTWNAFKLLFFFYF